MVKPGKKHLRYSSPSNFIGYQSHTVCLLWAPVSPANITNDPKVFRRQSDLHNRLDPKATGKSRAINGKMTLLTCADSLTRSVTGDELNDGRKRKVEIAIFSSVEVKFLLALLK